MFCADKGCIRLEVRALRVTEAMQTQRVQRPSLSERPGI